MFRLLSEQISSLLQAQYDNSDRSSRQAALENAALGFQKAMGVAAHQFRNLLGPTRWSQTAYNGIARDYHVVRQELSLLNARLGQNLDRLDAVVDRMPELIGPITIHPEEFDLEELIQDVLGKRRSDNLFDIDLLGLQPNLKVFLDPHCIRIVVHEIASNSFQIAGRDGKGQVCAHADLWTDATGLSRVRVVLSDNGPGIPMERRDKIFGPAYSNRPDGSRSTGWGLYYVKRAIEAHGGQIAVVDGPLSGANFAITLPQRFERKER